MTSRNGGTDDGTGGGTDVGDPFGTWGLRDRVLRAWAESPARFREDANAEEDFALGGYRDRVVVELAQNAADAAQRRGVPGRLRLVLRGGELIAENAGAPLDAAGVEALSTLRASAKRDEPGAVGRFGVGFAAVVAVTDEPAIASPAGGGVMWSAARARKLIGEVPELAAEFARRQEAVPLLRLPFPAPLSPRERGPGPGFDTVVRLPLRDAAAEELVRRQLDQVGPALMLALPALRTVEIEVDGHARTLAADHDQPAEGGAGTVTINGTAWRTIEAGGELAPELLADRPAEERARPHWRVRWAMPVERPAAGLARPSRGLPEDVPAVLHAPTPSDERLDLPALLIATFPMATDRRHVAPGPLADHLTERAADAYLGLLQQAPADPRLLDLIPGPVAAGELDARIRRAILARIPETPLLPAGRRDRLKGRDAVLADAPAPLLDLLTGTGDAGPPVLRGLLPPDWPVRHPALAALEVRRMDLADIIDLLSGLDRPPLWWRRVYETLTGVGGAGHGGDADALGALPVPLVAGASAEAGERRLMRGPRGLLIAAGGVRPENLGALEEAALGGPGLRFVHPDAVHPLLLRLGAIEAGPRVVLTDPAVRAAVEGVYDGADPDSIARAVLDLVAAAGLTPGDEPWLAELPLPAEDGERYPAGELLLPGSPLRAVVAADSPFGIVAAELVERYGPGPLEAVGVLNDFAVVRATDVGLTALADSGGDAFELADEELWADDVLDRLPARDGPALLPEFAAVRDLELVADWAAALRLLARPPLRALVLEPAYVMSGGHRLAVPSYTAWWLARQPILAGRRPAEFRLPAAEEDADTDLLAGLYDTVPDTDLDPEFLLALGVRTALGDLLDDPAGVAELLDRMANPARTVPQERLSGLWTALADAATPDDIDPPERVRALVDGRPEVVPATDALVLDAPDLLPLLAGQPLIVAARGRARALADLLDLPTAGDEIPGVVESPGRRRPVPPAVRAVLPDAPPTYVAHDELLVDGRPVPWRYEESTGTVHAADMPGLARALAWATDRWPARLLAEAVLRDPAALPALLTEQSLTPASSQPPGDDPRHPG